MSGATDPVQEDLPFETPVRPPASAETPAWVAARPKAELAPSLYEQLLTRLRAIPWARWRAAAAPVLKSGAGRLSTVARVAVSRSGSVARVAVKRGAPYTVRLAKATARISLIRAFPLLVARTIHLFGFPAVVLRGAIQFAVAHRAGLAIDEVTYFVVDDPAGYTVYEAPPWLGTAISIAYITTL